MSVTVLFIGSPLLDVQVDIKPDFLEKYNLKSNDCISAREEKDEKLFKEIQYMDEHEVLLTPGGSAQNSARICKWVLNSEGNVAFFGCVGYDINGQKMHDALKRDDVLPIYVKDDSRRTGICACLLSPGGNRSMVTDQGAAASLRKQHLEIPEVKQILEESTAVYIVSYVLIYAPDVVTEIAQFCNSHDKLFAINLSAPFVCEKYVNALVKCIYFSELVFGNREEAATFIKNLPEFENAETTSEALAKAIADMRRVEQAPRMVVISDGCHPVVLCLSNSWPQKFEVPDIGNALIDGVGCGDALAGACLAAFLMTRFPEEAVKVGIKAATQIAKCRGCPSTTSLPQKVAVATDQF